MSVLLKRVEWYGNGGQDQVEVLNDVERIRFNKSAESKASTAEIYLKNPIDRVLVDGSNNRTVNKYVGDDFYIRFGEGDIVKIYVKYSSSGQDSINNGTNSPDLVMVAEVSEVECDSGDKKSSIRLTCVDKTFVVLNKLWSFDYSNSSFTSPQIIQDVIRQVSETTKIGSFDSSGNVASTRSDGYEIDARLMTGTTYQGLTAGDPPAYIQIRRPDNSVFPATRIAKVFKPAYEYIQELSSPEHTNTEAELDSTTTNPPCNRNYVFYIDENNRFHWFYPPDGVSMALSANILAADTTIPVDSLGSTIISNGIIQIESELITYTGISGNSFTGASRGAFNTIAVNHSANATVTTTITIIEGDASNGHKVNSFKLTIATFDVVNMVIFNAGKDMQGSGILNYFYDQNTRSKELKMVYRPWTEIARDMIKAELPTGEGGNNNLVKDNTTPGPFTYEGNFYDNASAYNLTTSWGATVTSDSNYNDSLRDYAAFNASSKGMQRSKALTKSRGSPRWKGTISMKGFKYTPNDLIRFTSYRCGIYNQDLRIKEVQHTIDGQGWFSTLTVEEDERTLSAK